jgi:hypothetical protein
VATSSNKVRHQPTPPVGIEHPVERLATMRTQMDHLKHSGEAVLATSWAIVTATAATPMPPRPHLPRVIRYFVSF